jgi:hypothetical protein
MGNLLSLDLSIHERRLKARTGYGNWVAGAARGMSQADTLQRTLNQHAAARTLDYRVRDTAQSVLLGVRVPVPGNPLLSTQRSRCLHARAGF